jgi:hypothetical protein
VAQTKTSATAQVNCFIVACKTAEPLEMERQWMKRRLLFAFNPFHKDAMQ